jgi:DNA modification methylase
VRWLREARRVLKAEGTLWVTGTHHIIFSLGFALQTLGYRIINSVVWQKPDPPPNALLGLTRFREPIRVERSGSVKGVEEDGQDRQTLLA